MNPVFQTLSIDTVFQVFALAGFAVMFFFGLVIAEMISGTKAVDKTNQEHKVRNF